MDEIPLTIDLFNRIKQGLVATTTQDLWTGNKVHTVDQECEMRE